MAERSAPEGAPASTSLSPLTLDRRTLVKGAAWSVPAVALVAATPAMAASLNPGSIVLQTISIWGGGGQGVQGNFVVQANKGVGGDKRTVVLTAIATLYKLENGNWVAVGTIALTPQSSGAVALDGGHQQFNYNDGNLLLVRGVTYRIQVVATGVVSDQSVYTATLVSQNYTAW